MLISISYMTVELDGKTENGNRKTQQIATNMCAKKDETEGRTDNIRKKPKWALLEHAV